MKKIKKLMIRAMALCSATCFLLGACAESAKTVQNSTTTTELYSQKLNGSIQTNQEDFYDENVIYQLPDSVALNTEISVIVVMNTESRKDGKAFTYPEHRMQLTTILHITLRTSHLFQTTRRS